MTTATAAKKLYYIDLSEIDAKFDSYEQEIFNSQSVKNATGGVKHANLGVWCDTTEQKFCGTNKANLKKAWNEYKRQVIADSKALGWYSAQDAETIENLFSQKINTLA